MPHLSAFRAGAPSMPAGSHEMRDYYSNSDPPRSSPHTAPSITPYLGLRSRLSQVWINRWTILILLALARTLITLSSINTDLGSARREALSACSSVESMGSAMASMPHYMSQGVNEIAASGVEHAVNGLFQMTLMSVTGVEEIVLFVINMMTSTYLCLITLAVGGSLHAAIDVISAAQDELKSLTSSLGDDMADILKTFDDAYNGVKDAVDGVGSTIGSILGGKSITFPTLNLDDDINKLRDLQLPDDLDAKLQQLNNSIPNFADVQNFTNNAIRFPFEQVKVLINDSLGTYTFDRSVFPVPQKAQLSFCGADDGVDKFFDDLVDLAHMAKKIFIGVLVAAAILACIPMGYREIRRWRTQQERAQLVGSSAHDPMDVVYIVSRPYTSTAGIKMSNAVNSTRRQILIRWVVAYATTDAALFVLALAIAGLFSCLCQYILLKELSKQVPALSSQVGQFADQVVTQLNNASEQWAIDTNAVIGNANQNINEEMFGWVNTTTDALNATLNTFVDLTMTTLNDTFGGTPLYEPIKEVLNCLILLKVAGIQKALTWVEENAQVNFPTFPNDTFSVGAVASIAGDSQADESFLATPGDQATDKITTAVARFILKVEEAVKQEAIISLVILLIWIFVALIGVSRALILWFGRDKNRGEGGSVPRMAHEPSPTSDFRDVPLDDFAAPARPRTPAPEYTQSVATKAREDFDDGNPFADTKTGYAGQREPNLARSRTGIRSERASIWTGKS